MRRTEEVALAWGEVDEEGPAIGAFLDFLERDIQRSPERLGSFAPAFVAGMNELTDGVEIDLHAPLSHDDH